MCDLVTLLINEVGSGFRVEFIDFSGASIGTQVKPQILADRIS